MFLFSCKKILRGPMSLRSGFPRGELAPAFGAKITVDVLITVVIVVYILVFGENVVAWWRW